MTFMKLKEGFTIAPILHLPYYVEQFELICDAFDYAVGLVLGERVDKKHRTIYYANHTLNKVQVNYHDQKGVSSDCF